MVMVMVLLLVLAHGSGLPVYTNNITRDKLPAPSKTITHAPYSSRGHSTHSNHFRVKKVFD